MIHYDFDQIIERRGTGSIKFDTHRRHGISEDAMPLWVADMDFPVAKEIRDALHREADQGVFGYSVPDDAYYEAVLDWYADCFHWHAKREWIVCTPGVVFALAMAVRAFAEPRDGVVIQRPVYYPFGNIIKANDRREVNNPLVLRDGRYEMNFEDLEEKLSRPSTKLMILSSPHNPVGRVWTEAELRRVADLCLANDVILVSDEIHSDFAWMGHRHSILTSLAEEYQNNTIVCTAPTKTFNLAGLQVSNIFIPDRNLHHRFKKAVEQTGYGLIGQMGIAACREAYKSGSDWLEQVRRYIQENIRFTGEYLTRNMPGIKLIDPEGTYLLWLDCRELSMDGKALDRWISEDAGLWLDGGTMFGAEGEGFQRLNAACPQAYLKQALDRWRDAYERLQGGGE